MTEVLSSRVRTVDGELRSRAARVIPGGMFGHMSVKALPPEYP